MRYHSSETQDCCLYMGKSCTPITRRVYRKPNIWIDVDGNFVMQDRENPQFQFSVGRSAFSSIQLKIKGLYAAEPDFMGGVLTWETRNPAINMVTAKHVADFTFSEGFKLYAEWDASHRDVVVPFKH